jgi:hypothetical protein
VAQTPGTSIPVDSVLQAELARALMTADNATARLDATDRAVLSSFADEGLIKIDQQPTVRAAAAVLLAPSVDEATVSGATASPSDDQDVFAETWIALAAAMDGAGRGAVVTGPPSSATRGGVVAELRAGETNKRVSTVDTAGSPMGDVAAVLALRQQLAGGVGAYGFGKAASTPLPSATEVQ